MSMISILPGCSRGGDRFASLEGGLRKRGDFVLKIHKREGLGAKKKQENETAPHPSIGVFDSSRKIQGICGSMTAYSSRSNHST